MIWKIQGSLFLDLGLRVGPNLWKKGSLHNWIVYDKREILLFLICSSELDRYMRYDDVFFPELYVNCTLMALNWNGRGGSRTSSLPRESLKCSAPTQRVNGAEVLFFLLIDLSICFAIVFTQHSYFPCSACHQIRWREIGNGKVFLGHDIKT